MCPAHTSETERELLLNAGGPDKAEQEAVSSPVAPGRGGGKETLAEAGTEVEMNPERMPAFDYELFLCRMRHPACRPIVSQTKDFISSLGRQQERGISISQLVHQYRDFVDTTMEAIRENPVWRLMGDARPDEFELAREGIEYLLLNQLHAVLFSPPEDRDRDAHIRRKMTLYADWIQPIHLDLPVWVGEQDALLVAGIGEFGRVNEYITPRDKLICFLNGCRHLQRLVEARNPEASADEMLPIIIFALVKSRIAQLHSNLQYISRFRDGRVLAGEKSGYLFTGLLAASTFIETMDQKSLVVRDDEYAERMEEGMMRLNAQTLDEQELAASASMFAEGGPSPGAEEINAADRSASSPPLSPDARLREEATRLYHNVKEKLRLGASKSFDYLGRLVDEAEAQIKAAINSGNGSPRPAPDSATERALQDEDEFQLQLAMALSLSEQDPHPQQATGGPAEEQLLTSDPAPGGEDATPDPAQDIAQELADLDFAVEDSPPDPLPRAAP